MRWSFYSIYVIVVVKTSTARNNNSPRKIWHRYSIESCHVEKNHNWMSSTLYHPTQNLRCRDCTRSFCRSCVSALRDGICWILYRKVFPVEEEDRGVRKGGMVEGVESSSF